MEVCIPFYLDIECLRACLNAVKRFVKPERVIVNNASPEVDMTQICEESDLPYTITNLAGTDPCEVLDYLFSKTKSDTVLFLDQDCLILKPLFNLVKCLDEGVALLGPLDIFFVTGEQVKGQKIHNFLSRLTPVPGYIHASFMLINAFQIREKFGTKPIRLPTNVKLHGYGSLGAEPYFGITYRCRQAKLPIEFMFMLPGFYGTCSELAYNNIVYAIHLWYSSRVIGRKTDELLDHDWQDGGQADGRGNWVPGNVQVGWLISEKQRFLKDYWSNNLKIKWGLPL